MADEDGHQSYSHIDVFIIQYTVTTVQINIYRNFLVSVPNRSLYNIISEGIDHPRFFVSQRKFHSKPILLQSQRAFVWQSVLARSASAPTEVFKCKVKSRMCCCFVPARRPARELWLDRFHPLNVLKEVELNDALLVQKVLDICRRSLDALTRNYFEKERFMVQQHCVLFCVRQICLPQAKIFILIACIIFIVLTSQLVRFDAWINSRQRHWLHFIFVHSTYYGMCQLLSPVVLWTNKSTNELKFNKTR